MMKSIWLLLVYKKFENIFVFELGKKVSFQKSLILDLVILFYSKHNLSVHCIETEAHWNKALQ